MKLCIFFKKVKKKKEKCIEPEVFENDLRQMTFNAFMLGGRKK